MIVARGDFVNSLSGCAGIVSGRQSVVSYKTTGDRPLTAHPPHDAGVFCSVTQLFQSFLTG
jgi:hypothetical protein